jgi:hypothetical protein
MTMSFWGRAWAVTAALLGGLGLFTESTPIVVLATIAAIGSVIGWVRWSSPHDHWRQFRRRRPWDP